MPQVPLLEASGAAAVRRPLVAAQVLSLPARDAVDLSGRTGNAPGRLAW